MVLSISIKTMHDQFGKCKFKVVSGIYHKSYCLVIRIPRCFDVFVWFNIILKPIPDKIFDGFVLALLVRLKVVYNYLRQTYEYSLGMLPISLFFEGRLTFFIFRSRLSIQMLFGCNIRFV